MLYTLNIISVNKYVLHCFLPCIYVVSSWACIAFWNFQINHLSMFLPCVRTRLHCNWKTCFYLLDFFDSGIQFYVLFSPYLCFISFLYLDLYVNGNAIFQRERMTLIHILWLLSNNNQSLLCMVWYIAYFNARQFIACLCQF